MDKAQKYSPKFHGLEELGYSYDDADKVVDMVDFHIDCEEFIYLIIGTHYRGFLSFSFPEGQIPVTNIGHDECIFRSYIFLQSCGRVLMGKLY